jgi:hypothetical protein
MVTFCSPDVGVLFCFILAPGFARAQAANIFYCAVGAVKAMRPRAGYDLCRTIAGARHSPFQADAI